MADAGLMHSYSAICLGPHAHRAAGVLTLRSRLIISWASAAGRFWLAPDVHRDIQSLRRRRHRAVQVPRDAASQEGGPVWLPVELEDLSSLSVEQHAFAKRVR